MSIREKKRSDEAVFVPHTEGFLLRTTQPSNVTTVINYFPAKKHD